MGSPVPALIVLSAAYLTPGLIGYSLFATVDTETSGLSFVPDFLCLATMGVLSFKRLVPYLGALAPKFLSLFGVLGRGFGSFSLWLLGLRLLAISWLGVNNQELPTRNSKNIQGH